MPLSITKDFISLAEQEQIISHLPRTVKLVSTGRNRVLRYGSKLPYNAKLQSKTIPTWIEFVLDRLLAKKFLTERPDHLTINEYREGQSIDWHVDSKGSGPIITVLSLLSDASMGLKDNKGQEVKYPVPARSLLQMSEKERWEDQHCIYPVSDLRYSLVFRKGTT